MSVAKVEKWNEVERAKPLEKQKERALIKQSAQTEFETGLTFTCKKLPNVKFKSSRQSE